MDKFYVIEVINKNGESGFIISKPEGIFVSTNGYAIDTTQFNSYEKAEIFKRKLKGKFKKIIIRRNDYIAEKHANPIGEREIFVILNNLGERLFYDARQEGYYFENRETGCCCWFSEQEAKTFIDSVRWVDKPEMTIKKIENENTH